MNKIRKEIECIHRLQELTGFMDDMLNFLFSENLMTKDEIRLLKSSPDQAKVLQEHLARISTDNRTQLLEYTWNFLPVERIKILILTDRNNKEFTYNF